MNKALFDAVLFLLPLVSSVITLVLMIPFINFMYKMGMVVENYNENKDIFGVSTPVFSKIHAHKVGTPRGAGLLIVLVSLVFFSIVSYFLKFNPTHFLIITVTFLSFGLVGFLDDYRKTFAVPGKDTWSLRSKHKLYLEILISFVLGLLLILFGFNQITFINRFSINNVFFFLLFTSLFIPFMSESFNINDGLDGLSTGLLMISLVPLSVIAVSTGKLDLLVFCLIFLGSLLPFFYFNVNPARILLGDTGALPFGAFLAVFAILTGSIFPVVIVCLVFLVEGCSSLVQLLSKKYRGKKVFLSAPLHHHFEALGWEETKITERMWVFGILSALLGLFIFYVQFLW